MVIYFQSILSILVYNMHILIKIDEESAVQRNIHFDTILKKIDRNIEQARKKYERPLEYFIKLKSEINSMDRDIAQLFNNSILVNELGKAKRDHALIKKFNDDYALLARQIKEIGKATKEQAERMNKKDDEAIAAALRDIASDLLIMYKHIPPFSDRADPHLIKLAKALGGVCIAISQSELPTAGAELDQQGSDKRSGGICAGLVMSWAEQSYQNGTPYYPITSNIVVLNSFENQHFLKEDVYTVEKVDKVNQIDLFQHLATLEENCPYYIAIRDNAVGHAIGIRKQAQYIEIYDPNYGHVFLRETNEAATWLNALFQYYQSTKFPCDDIVFFRYKNKGDDYIIPESKFPTEFMINEVTYFPHTEVGNAVLIEKFKHHQRVLCLYAEETNIEISKKNTILLSALKNMIRYLSVDDLKILLTILGSCKNNQNYPARIKQLLHSSVYDNLRGNAELEDVMTELQQNIAARDAVLTDKQVIINRIKAYEQASIRHTQDITKKIIELRIKNSDPALIKELVQEQTILTNRRNKLLGMHIDGKLYSGQVTVAEAKDILMAYKPEEVKKVMRSAEMLRYKAALNTVERIQDGFLTIGYSLNERMLNVNDLLSSKQKERVVAYKIKLVNEKQEQLETVKQALLNEESLAGVEATLNKIYPGITDIVQNPCYSDETWLVKEFETYLNELTEKASSKYTKDEYIQLKKLYAYISDLPGSIQGALNAELDKNLTDYQKKVVAKLKEDIAALRLLFISAVNPDTGKVIEVADFVKLIRDLSPTSFDKQGERIEHPYQFKWHYELPEQPARILAIIKDMKDNDPDSQTDAFYSKYEEMIQYWVHQAKKDVKMANDFYTQFFVEFRIPVDTKPYDVSDDQLIKAVQTKRDAVVAAIEAAKKQALLEQRSDVVDHLVAVVESGSFWSDKVSMFNPKGAPDGILLMRSQIARLVALKNADRASYNDKVIDILSNVSTQRINRFNAGLFYSITRDEVTDNFYHLCRAAKANLVDVKQAKYVNHALYKKMSTEFDNHNREVVHLGLITRN